MEGEEEEMLQPGTYGKALAMYLQEQFRSRGYTVPLVICRRHHWQVASESHKLQLTCREYAQRHHYLCDLLGSEVAPEQYPQARRDLEAALYRVPGIRVLSEEISDF